MIKLYILTTLFRVQQVDHALKSLRHTLNRPTTKFHLIFSSSIIFHISSIILLGRTSYANMCDLRDECW